jgi:hypothetical protein
MSHIPARLPSRMIDRRSLLQSGQCVIRLITDKHGVTDALNRLPEVTSPEEITEELRVMAAIRLGRCH